jgi:hypothetical protein
MIKPTPDLRKWAYTDKKLSRFMFQVFNLVDVLAMHGPAEKERTLLSDILDAFDCQMRREENILVPWTLESKIAFITSIGPAKIVFEPEIEIYRVEVDESPIVGVSSSFEKAVDIVFDALEAEIARLVSGDHVRDDADQEAYEKAQLDALKESAVGIEKRKSKIWRCACNYLNIGQICTHCGNLKTTD